MLKDSLKDTTLIKQNPSSEKKNPEQKKDEFGGPKGLEPTRYGDWEVNGRVSDF